MLIRSAIAFILAGAVLSACQPAVPDSGRGIGFDSPSARAARDAALARSSASAVPAPASVTSAPLGAPAYNDGSAAATAAETQRVLNATRSGGFPVPADTGATLASGGAPLGASPDNPAPGLSASNSIGISNENDFDAVAAQQTIASDKARIAANAAQYQVILPEALPDRSASSGQPNIVAYALRSNHPLGQSVYNRGIFNGESKSARNCAKYAAPDLAQIAFLERGGPERDRLGLDPDGDGYACAWDPTPFRAVSRG